MTMLGVVKTDGRGGRLSRWLTFALAAAALPVAACSLDVTDPASAQAAVQAAFQAAVDLLAKAALGLFLP